MTFLTTAAPTTAPTLTPWVSTMTPEQTAPLAEIFRAAGHDIPAGTEHQFVVNRLANLIKEVQ